MKTGNTLRTLVGLAILTACMAPSGLAEIRNCNANSLRGSYAFTGKGSFISPPQLAGPLAEVGVQNFDGRGGTTYSATLSLNGHIIPVTATGTYTVNPDCTGTMTVQVAPFGATVNLFFVISASGMEFRAIETEEGTVITRVGKRQVPVADPRDL